MLHQPSLCQRKMQYARLHLAYSYTLGAQALADVGSHANQLRNGRQNSDAECGFVSKAFVVAEQACAYSPWWLCIRLAGSS